MKPSTIEMNDYSGLSFSFFYITKGPRTISKREKLPQKHFGTTMCYLRQARKEAP